MLVRHEQTRLRVWLKFYMLTLQLATVELDKVKSVETPPRPPWVPKASPVPTTRLWRLWEKEHRTAALRRPPLPQTTYIPTTWGYQGAERTAGLIPANRKIMI